MANLYKHLFIEGYANREDYKATSSFGPQLQTPRRDRVAHSTKLLSQFQRIWDSDKLLKNLRTAQNIKSRQGTYLSFTSAVGYDLVTKSLEHISRGIRLLCVKKEVIDTRQVQTRAIVYIPKGEEGYFINKIRSYQTRNTQVGNPKNADLVNSIEDVSIALLEGLWISNLQLIPTDAAKWCEAWLNVDADDDTRQEQIADFLKMLGSININYKQDIISFPERAVLLIEANRSQLIELMVQSDLLAELRIGQEPAGFWMNENSIEQQGWVDNLLQRLELMDSDVKICLLDSGVNNGHQLLEPLINDNNTLAVNNAWGTNDHNSHSGHGTLMAGLAGYGNLERVLSIVDKISITHQLCSVKILPPPLQAETPKELWGEITQRGISIAEIKNPEIRMIYCMAITAKEDAEKGRPSSWSGAIDNITFNDGDSPRLVIISAGNVHGDDNWMNYPNSNFETTIENPAQSWNAITVGAYTKKALISDPIFQGYKPLAKEGELSPYSSTSICWGKKWPVKPDVVFEGGNLLIRPDNSITSHADLELLSTSKAFRLKPFNTMYATSAATAQASWFAAKIAYEYPEAWPETIRGLMIHSAQWNNAMLNQMRVKAGNRSSYKNLLKVFGFGVPDLNRALHSQESALTYISQETIQPFAFNQKRTPITNDIHFFKLPWPSELLLGMGEIPVVLKITLSYYIEPGAGEIGWKDKYRYQSHGLRFDINNIGEAEIDFRKRINVAAREEDDEVNSSSGSERWSIGVNNRSDGSIHSDFWEGTAADLSTCNHIAVFPVIGWWRERKHLGCVENNTRYSLIISLDTPVQDVELYTTVKNMIQIPIKIAAT